MKGNFGFIVCAALLCGLMSSSVLAGSAHHPATYSGVIFQNGFAHRINLTEPQDSNMVVMDITGTPEDGKIYINVTGPSSFCIGAIPASCGRYVQDTSAVLESIDGDIYLKSHVNNPNPLVNGRVTNYQVVGKWTDKQLNIFSSESIDINTLTGIHSVVPLSRVYAGKTDIDNDFMGKHFGFVIPYVSVRHEGKDPYEYLVTFGDIDSSQPFSAVAGYRVYSPAATLVSVPACNITADPLFPATPSGVFGTISDAVFVKGILSGFISMSTPVGTHVNVTNLPFSSDFEWVNKPNGHVRINYGIATESAQVQYFMHNMLLRVTKDD